ncbi:MAG TPA: hypothetical protein VMH80_11425 [Bryobacteraceae bacterium]|nr:hypothetical protein [Bryobacteraceae bacterium]
MPRPQAVGALAGGCEQPKAFSFPVTFETLLAQLKPVEVAKREPVTALVPQVEVIPREVPSRALQVVEAPPLADEDEAAWEMVVPKMVRRPL